MNGHLPASLALVACLSTLAACGDKVNPAASCDLVSRPVTYTGTMNQLLTQRCTSCHASKNKGAARFGATVGVDFDTYDSAVKWGEESREWVMGGLMPPPPSVKAPGVDPNNGVPLEDRCAFATWADAGFPH